MLVLGLGYAFLVAPVLQHQGHELLIMQTAFDALPRYPGSTQVFANATNQLGHQVDIVAGYRYPGLCSSVQRYYNTQARRVGWSVTKPLYIVRAVNGPSGNELHIDYQKSVSGLRLDPTVACSSHQDGSDASDQQDIYDLQIAQAP